MCHGYGELAQGFLANFEPVADASRTIIAPEALSRFYLDGTRGGSHVASSVGATWMTREDRDHEIADQVSYLDTLYDVVMAGVALDAAPRVTVLGFSQGVATVCRWLDRGRTRAHRLVCWGGAIPDDVALADGSPIRASALSLVVGSRDVYATPDRVAQQEARLRAAGMPFRTLGFVGGHRLDDATILALAAAA